MEISLKSPRKLAWRNTKADVQSEIVIPPQSKQVRNSSFPPAFSLFQTLWVEQSPIERIFYCLRREENDVISDMSLRQLSSHFSVGPQGVPPPKTKMVKKQRLVRIIREFSKNFLRIFREISQKIIENRHRFTYRT